MLSREDDVLRRWAEHSDEMLNTEYPNQNTIGQDTYQTLQVTDEPTATFDEVENAIESSRITKQREWMDLIQAGLINKGSPKFVERMRQLIIKLWITETIAEERIGELSALHIRRETCQNAQIIEV